MLHYPSFEHALLPRLDYDFDQNLAAIKVIISLACIMSSDRVVQSPWVCKFSVSTRSFPYNVRLLLLYYTFSGQQAGGNIIGNGMTNQ